MKSIYLYPCLMLLFFSSQCLVFGSVLNGDGSSGNPYLIGSVSDFNTFADPGNAATYWAPGVHVQLKNNIDLSGSSYSTAVIAPDTSPASIAFDGIPYEGNFDGNGYEISNININDSAANSNLGLFGYVRGAIIKNLGLVNCLINAGFQGFSVIQNTAYIGTLAGYFEGGTVSNCYSSGAIEVNAHSSQEANVLSVGGLFGYFDGTMSDSSSECSVTVSATSDLSVQLHTVGGLCGVSDGAVSRCWAAGPVTATAGKSTNSNPYITFNVNEIGGLCGRNNANVQECYSSGAVKCSANSYTDSILHSIGGLIGYNLYGPISDSYTVSSVYGSALADNRIARCYNIGGFTGSNHQNVDRCYSAASFTIYTSGRYPSEYNIGGFCGVNAGVINGSFWDTNLSEMTLSAGGTGKTTAEMGSETMYIAAGWDFDAGDGTADWFMSGGYPKLAWEPVDIVDAEDFALLARYWLMTGCSEGQECDAADLVDDDSIDVLDLRELVGSWLR